jgi:transposase InsO family protein
MNVIKQYQHHTTKAELFEWVDFPRSSYYYKPSGNRKGIAPSTTTPKLDGTVVRNEEVVEDIKKVLSAEFVCYGYQNVTAVLKSMDYIINHKKVYRLMNESKLLLGKVISTHGKRDFVKFRKITASRPMEYLCLDIKYVWVSGERKNYYLLSVMDVFTRRIVGYIYQSSIRKIDVIKLLGRLHQLYGLKGVFVRNDNGSQFIANMVRQYLRSLEAHQEFTHIATPEENAYIEAFHSVFEREVIRRFDFESYYESKQTIAAYMDFYNNKRLHGSLKRRTPIQVWNEYYQAFSSDKHQSAAVSEELSRVSDCADTRLALDKSRDTANFADRMMNENNENIKQEVLYSFEKSVQVIGG